MINISTNGKFMTIGGEEFEGKMIKEETFPIEGMSNQNILRVVLAKLGLTYNDVTEFVQLRNAGRISEAKRVVPQEVLDLISTLANQQPLTSIKTMAAYSNVNVVPNRFHSDGLVDIHSQLPKQRVR